ncbi:phosphoribosylformylglycinamidine synthase [Paenibacillus oralis]|uniref:Phosphoribosylformylglycinamidine synthase n=1 Tax=Paenibacillus oralis TaxID=2490856 RepID=A0A3P3UA97_9BACL|nr:AIR synthase related protein [Paenibacillus oralis]RRJ67277.1 phosphoribosylformylglycinamidine synthase [Paenibacillus oralis]
MEALARMIEELVQSAGIRRKREILPLLRVLPTFPEGMLDPIGDDAAVLPDGDGYLLLSGDGILPELARDEPFWAGYCAVLVSVSDIYAMGGRPTAMINLLSAPDEAVAVLIAEGMAEGCRKLGVPMVGGHYLPGVTAGVGTAILGRATRLLRGTSGRPGHSLIVAIDLNGRQVKHYPQWDSTSFHSAESIRRKLELLPALAEAGMAVAARDISNAGVLGTIAMLAENAGCGASIRITSIPKPEAVEWEWWLRVYPGYGFVLSAEPQHCDALVALFAGEGITACVVGELTDDPRIVVRYEEDEAVLIDWLKEEMVVGKVHDI